MDQLLFVVMFKNGQVLYHGGEIVEGIVSFNLAEATTIRGIRVKFNGEGSVLWKVTTGGGRHTHTHTYSRMEHYLNTEILIAGRLEQMPGEDLQLLPGQYSFPFAFQLPPNIPASFEGTVGHVRYSVTATIERPRKPLSFRSDPFTVVHILDLNAFPIAGIAVQGSNSKEFCCSCGSGPVSVTFRLDKSGFVPGEAILINAEINNRSNKKMLSSAAVLMRHITYNADRRSKTESAAIARLAHGEIAARGTHQWNGEPLVVPAVHSSFLAGSTVIDIRYTMELHVAPTGLGSNVVVALDVIIGNIPLGQVSVQQPPIDNRQLQAPMPPPVTMPNSEWNIPSAGGAYPLVESQPVSSFPTAPLSNKKDEKDSRL